MTRGAATLEDLLAGDGQRMTTPAMRWMLLTWDLACIDGKSDKYYRFLLVDTASLSLYGRRSPAAFATSAPSRGTVGKIALIHNAPLAAAMTKTREKSEGGYAMICAPLAVNCAAFASEVQAPGDLLMAVKDGDALGTRVLAHVNTARADAFGTHLAPGTNFTFPGHSARALWAGS